MWHSTKHRLGCQFTWLPLTPAPIRRCHCTADTIELIAAADFNKKLIMILAQEDSMPRHFVDVHLESGTYEKSRSNRSSRQVPLGASLSSSLVSPLLRHGAGHTDWGGARRCGNTRHVNSPSSLRFGHIGLPAG